MVRPRLRLWHLMALVLGAALVMGLLKLVGAVPIAVVGLLILGVGVGGISSCRVARAWWRANSENVRLSNRDHRAGGLLWFFFVGIDYLIIAVACLATFLFFTLVPILVVVWILNQLY